MQHNSITASEIYEKSKHINRTQQFSEVIIESSNEDLYLRRNKNDDLKIAEIPSQTIQKRFSNFITFLKSVFIKTNK